MICYCEVCQDFMGETATDICEDCKENLEAIKGIVTDMATRRRKRFMDSFKEGNIP